MFIMPEFTSKQNKIVIFDWDDTLYPTTFYKQNIINDQDISVSDLNSLSKLSESIFSTLTKYILTFGPNNTFIVTNASRSWIVKSLYDMVVLCGINRIDNSFGLILQIISQKIVKTISARDDHEFNYPKQPALWKQFAFEQIVMNQRGKDCLIAIGDSNDEYIASEKVARRTHISSLHRIKLKDHPNIDDLVNQHKLIKSIVPAFAQQTSPNITIDYDREQALYNLSRAKSVN